MVANGSKPTGSRVKMRSARRCSGWLACCDPSEIHSLMRWVTGTSVRSPGTSRRPGSSCPGWQDGILSRTYEVVPSIAGVVATR